MHTTAVKYVLCYFKDTVNKWEIIKANGIQALDCYVDSDFVRNFSTYSDQDPTTTKSCMGNVLLMSNTMDFQNANMMCSFYNGKSIALSEAMWDLIPMKNHDLKHDT